MIKIPESHESTIRLKEAEEKLAVLFKDRSVQQAALDRATTRYLSSKRPNQQSRLEAEAEQLLSGAATGAEPNDLMKEIETTQHRIAVLDVAIEKQRRAIDKVRSEFSFNLCSANRANYVAIERRIAKAVAELAAANEEEAKFFNELRDAGCSSISFRPMRVTSIGCASDTQSGAALHRRELERFVPEAVRSLN